MKRLLSLTAMLLIAVASFAYDFEVDGIYYVITSSSSDSPTVSVSYSNSNIVEIPKTVTYSGQTYSVTGITSYAFKDCFDLMSITIPESVTYIGYRAFYRCYGLMFVCTPDIAKWCRIDFDSNDSNPLIYAHRFYCPNTNDNSEITELVIPDGVTSISDYAFIGCSRLKNITIPSSVTSIGLNAFKDCTNPDIKFYVDKNTVALFELWGKVLNTQKIEDTYTSDCIYDVNTGEKIEFFNTTASSVSVKAFSPEPKNYTITSQSLKVDSKSVELPYSVTGLTPNTDSGKMSLTIKYKDAEGDEKTFTASQTVKTQKLTLTTEQPKVVSMGNVIVSATTNVDPEEKNVGFEWRREDWSSTFASQSGAAVVLDGTMEGYIRNLYTGKLWNYRAYYLSDSGTYYYGDWVGIDPTNTSYFEPTVHTYADISTSGKVALIRGYVLNGTDKITVQGFKYWKTANKGNSLDIDMEGDMQTTAIPADAITETVDIVGAGQQLMNATLKDLDYGSTYQCVAFATTSENETFYGEVQTFTTEADPTGIEGVKEDAGSSKTVTVVACYDINGKRLSAPQKGLNILRMSDGTTRKVVR